MTEFVPGEQLRHAYEALRAQATAEIGAEGPPARGLTLLLRSGLACWIQAWRRLVACPGQAPPPPRSSQGTRAPFELTAELAIILAQMALGGRAGSLLQEAST